jgi:hypothetical protein
MTKEKAANVALLIKSMILETIFCSNCIEKGDTFNANLHKKQVDLLEKALATELESEYETT